MSRIIFSDECVFHVSGEVINIVYESGKRRDLTKLGNINHIALK